MDHGTVRLGDLEVSRLLIGSNPFSGFSHQGPDRDVEMKHYFTTARIKQTLREAEEAGITAIIARADHYIMRLLMEYWDEGGTLKWIAQTCPELGPTERGIDNGIVGGASAVFIHGGVMDYLLAQTQIHEIPHALQRIREAGLPAGIAGHNPEVFRWAEENVNADFYMCSYYNSAHRDEQAEHVSGRPEWFHDEDRDRMVGCIAQLSKPAIHYKVLAAGRKHPEQVFPFVARHLRPMDAVCVGFFPKDNPRMVHETAALFQSHVVKRICRSSAAQRCVQ